MQIRLAVPQDLTGVLKLGQAMHAESRFRAYPVNPEKTHSLFLSFVSHPKSACILLAEHPEHGLPPVPGEGLAHWLAMAGQRNPAVLIQQASLAVAEQEVARQSAAHSPSLDLTASQGRNYTSGSISSPADISSRIRSTQVGVNFVVPLYAGGATQARIREAIALREKSAEELEGARRQSSTQARQAYSGVLNGHAQVQALESAVRSSENAVESNRIGYRIGTRINIDVLNAEQQLYAAQRDLTRARADVILSSLRLRASVGELTENDLATISRLLTEKPYEPQ